VDRERLRLALEHHDIEARPVWKPMHMQPVFSDCPVHGGSVSQSLFEQGLCLPSGSHLTTDDLMHVVTVIRHTLLGRHESAVPAAMVGVL
jgi:dTDP-4-amino-4,6-dideoxygalactose transaminase